MHLIKPILSAFREILLCAHCSQEITRGDYRGRGFQAGAADEMRPENTCSFSEQAQRRPRRLMRVTVSAGNSPSAVPVGVDGRLRGTDCRGNSGISTVRRRTVNKGFSRLCGRQGSVLKRVSARNNGGLGVAFVFTTHALDAHFTLVSHAPREPSLLRA